LRKVAGRLEPSCEGENSSEDNRMTAQRKDRRRDWPSDRVARANGLFVRMTGAIDHGEFAEAAEARAKLADLGFVVSLRPDRSSRLAAGQEAHHE
jgi:hypothetical protein